MNSTPSTSTRSGMRGLAAASAGSLAADLVHQPFQRAMTVDGDRPGRAAAKLIVEDLERQIAVIAGRGDRLHEFANRQIAFAGHVAEVAAPVEQVHVDQRRVGDLDDEDPVLRESLRIESTSILRASVWNESRISPMLAWSARRTISQASR